MLAAEFKPQYGRLLAHDPGTRLGTDPEELHQFRVATRRLRAFLRAGRQCSIRTWADSLREELGWLGGDLGPMRDLDVLIAHLRRGSRALRRRRRGCGELALALLEKRPGRRAGKSLRRRSTASAILRCSTAWKRRPPPARRARRDARGDPGGEHRRLRKAVEQLGDEPADEELHAVRIRRSARVTRPSWPGSRVREGGEAPAGRARRAPGRGRRGGAVARARRREPRRVALAAGRLIERQRARAGRRGGTGASAWKRSRSRLDPSRGGRGRPRQGVGEARGAPRAPARIRRLDVPEGQGRAWRVRRGVRAPRGRGGDRLPLQLGRELPSTRYRDCRADRKLVRWWRMTIADGDPGPANEVDEVRWLAPEDAGACSPTSATCRCSTPRLVLAAACSRGRAVARRLRGSRRGRA